MSKFSAISWEQVTFWWDDNDDVRFVLHQHAELDFYSARTHYSDSEETSLDSYSLVLHAHRRSKNFTVFGFSRSGLDPQSTTHEASTLNITPPMRFMLSKKKNLITKTWYCCWQNKIKINVWQQNLFLKRPFLFQTKCGLSMLSCKTII